MLMGFQATSRNPHHWDHRFYAKDKLRTRHEYGYRDVLEYLQKNDGMKPNWFDQEKVSTKDVSSQLGECRTTSRRMVYVTLPLVLDVDYGVEMVCE